MLFQTFAIVLLLGAIIFLVYLLLKREDELGDLRDAHILLKDVLDTIPVRVFWKDRQSRYLGCNRLFAEDAGLKSPDDIIGRTDKELVWAAQADIYISDDRRVMDKGEPLLYYEEPQDRQGNVLTWLETSKVPIRDRNGRIYGILGAYRDITRRKQAVQALVDAKKEAEEATILKDKFVSLVAHDLKNPLNIIMGYLEMIQYGDTDLDMVRSYAREGEKASLSMLRLIDDILDLSRIKGGGIMPELSFFDASSVSKEIFEEFSHLADRKGVRLIDDVPAGSRIFADKSLLHEVISNLISNSIKFCRKGDRVRLFIPKGEPSTIAVEDSGIGIDKKNIVNLFKYEEKTSKVGTAGEAGTGLGLPLSREIMEAQGGSLAVESEVGKGTIFYSRLPHIRPRIMVVEDEEDIRTSLVEMLSIIDAEFIIENSGDSAVRTLAGDTPHLIVSDIRMPGIDGFKLLELIRKNPQTREVPVIVITGDSNIETRDRAFRMGANDFINKPFSGEDLIPRVRRFTL